MEQQFRVAKDLYVRTRAINEVGEVESRNGMWLNVDKEQESYEK